MSELRSQILNYLDFLQDREYWNAIGLGYSAEELNTALLGLLHAESTDVVSSTCLFIRDLVQFAPAFQDEPRSSLPFDYSQLVPSLENLVRSPDLWKRKNTVYTLGKICSASSVPFLREVFEATKENDPLLLPDLAFEIAWLSGLKHEAIDWLVTQCLASQSYLTRWVTLEILSPGATKPGNECWKWKYNVLSQLIDDDAESVRANARFLRDEMDFEASLPNIKTRAEKRRQRKELEARRPENFNGISIEFLNNMYARGVSNYSVDELNKLVKGKVL